MRPKDNQEALGVMRQAAEVLDAVGPAVEFILAGKL
jgi:hypothetical protein